MDFDKAFVAFWIGAVLAGIGFWVGVGYVAWHFISKVW